MQKITLTGLLLMTIMFLCACGTNTESNIEIDPTTNATSIENEPPASSNATGTGNSAVPHYAYPPEEGILANETAVYFHSRYGEFDMGGLLVVDNERQYMKFELENGTWYTFYPYEKDTSIYLYSLSKTLATDIKTGTGIETLDEDPLRETVLLLNDYGVSHFFYFEVTPMGDMYMIKTHCSNINYEYPEQERNIIFYIDSVGNPIRESEWRDRPHQ